VHSIREAVPGTAADGDLGKEKRWCRRKVGSRKTNKRGFVVEGFICLLLPQDTLPAITTATNNDIKAAQLLTVRKVSRMQSEWWFGLLPRCCIAS
jgi:hypothetical protein